MEELKRSVAEVKNMEITMLSTLSRLEEKDSAINKNLERLSTLEASISNSLSKFILIGSILIGTMMVGWGLFSAWSVYIVSQNNETQKNIIENRNSSMKRDAEMDIKLLEMQKEQKAIVDGVAENNYQLHSHEDEQQMLKESLLSSIGKVISKNKPAKQIDIPKDEIENNMRR